MNNTKYHKHIRAIMPAPGWRVVCCAINDDQPDFWDEPIVGWVAVSSFDDQDEIELWTFQDHSYAAEVDFGVADNSTHHILPPGSELTDEIKAEMVQTVKNKQAYRAERKQKVAA